MSGHVALEDLDWHEDAIATITGLAQHQRIVTADDLAREMRKPPHPNMAGAAFSAARQLGYIEAAGYTTSTSKSRNSGVIRVWRRRPTRGDDMNHATAAALHNERPTDDELYALADELADAFEDRADQERKGER